MGAYDKFKSADVMGTRQWIEPGDHILLIRQCQMGPSKNPLKKGQENTIVTYRVIQSDSMKPGTTCSLVETDAQQGYAGNVLAFVAGVMGYTIDELKADEDFDAVFDGCFGTEQILTDMLVRCTAQQVKTTKGGDYTAKTWEPVEAAKYEDFGLTAPDGAYVDEEEAAEASDAA